MAAMFGWKYMKAEGCVAMAPPCEGIEYGAYAIIDGALGSAPRLTVALALLAVVLLLLGPTKPG